MSPEEEGWPREVGRKKIFGYHGFRAKKIIKDNDQLERPKISSIAEIVLLENFDEKAPENGEKNFVLMAGNQSGLFELK